MATVCPKEHSKEETTLDSLKEMAEYLTKELFTKKTLHPKLCLSKKTLRKNLWWKLKNYVMNVTMMCKENTI